MFCKKCGGLLTPKQGKLYCNTCDQAQDTNINLSSRVEKPKKILEDLKAEDLDSVVDKTCRKCGNKKALFAMKQMRSSDEPPTKFFRCTQCGNTWRDYN